MPGRRAQTSRGARAATHGTARRGRAATPPPTAAPSRRGRRWRRRARFAAARWRPRAADSSAPHEMPSPSPAAVCGRDVSGRRPPRRPSTVCGRAARGLTGSSRGARRVRRLELGVLGVARRRLRVGQPARVVRAQQVDLEPQPPHLLEDLAAVARQLLLARDRRRRLRHRGVARRLARARSACCDASRSASVVLSASISSSRDSSPFSSCASCARRSSASPCAVASCASRAFICDGLRRQAARRALAELVDPREDAVVLLVEGLVERHGAARAAAGWTTRSC